MNRTIRNSVFSREVPSDVTVHAGGTSFSLHKLPLLSKCGYIRKLVSQSRDVLDDARHPLELEAPDIPGGAEGFKLAAKFCYGIAFDIGTHNVVMLRCAAEYLEMTEACAPDNLVARCEAYLNDVALTSLAGSVSVLRACGEFFPAAERVNVVNRCVDAVARVACEESGGRMGRENVADQSFRIPVEWIRASGSAEWWAEEVSGLRIDYFRRVVVAMKARGFEECGLGPVLMLYVDKSLDGLETLRKGIRKRINPQEQHEKRVVIETITSLLPKTSLPITFLSALLRSASLLETTIACRLDLEKRMASQLGQATLDDLLIPSRDALFDSDSVGRILSHYLRHSSHGEEDAESVGKVMERYLAEIAFDGGLCLPKFMELAELLPEEARVSEDGMYRAIDIYLKAHPALSETDKKKLCNLINCQNLSAEACAHAAQNDRLPVQTTLQVLYHEQQRLRDHVMRDIAESPDPRTAKHAQRVPEEVSRLRRDNEDMKMELVEMKMRLQEIATSRMAPSADMHCLRRKSMVSAVAKRLGRLFPLFRAGASAPAHGRARPPKERRHSMS